MCVLVPLLLNDYFTEARIPEIITSFQFIGAGGSGGVEGGREVRDLKEMSITLACALACLNESVHLHRDNT